LNIEKVGYGAGSRTYEKFPNVLRAVLCQSENESPRLQKAQQTGAHYRQRRNRMRCQKFFLFILLLAGIGSLPTQAQSKTTESAEEIMRAVKTIHGGGGPFAILGYRMGQRALTELRATKGSFALEVVHRAPAEVQWSCIVDGLQAATGTSLGKLNLHLLPATRQTIRSTVTDRKSGKQVVFFLNQAFLKKYLNIPNEELEKAGETVLGLPDDELFTIQLVSSPVKHRR
jgi:formylmethanofuran dehydrogenase subunit E